MSDNSTTASLKVSASTLTSRTVFTNVTRAAGRTTSRDRFNQNLQVKDLQIDELEVKL